VTSLYIGSIGVCIGTAVASIANVIYMTFVYKNKAGIDIFKFYKKCWLPALPCYILVAVLSLLVVSLLPFETSWLSFVVKVACVTVIYFVVFFFVYLSPEDRKGLMGYIKKIKR